MPELPEVETVKNVLEPQIMGKAITAAAVNHAQVLANCTTEEFCGAIVGQVVSHMGRRGKFLSIVFESGSRLVLHLRMTGRLLVTPPDFETAKHTHVVVKLSDQNEIRFIDSRRFGRFWLIKNGERDMVSGVSKLGIEPFDKALTSCYLQEAIGEKNRTIKDCLLEQHIIAGIGNIYSDEILFRAKIHPSKKANQLSEAEFQTLARIIPETMQFFVEKNRISAEDYLKSQGQDYRNTPFLQVYGHKGESCPCCGTVLQHNVVSGRSNVYCPHCQKL